MYEFAWQEKLKKMESEAPHLEPKLLFRRLSQRSYSRRLMNKIYLTLAILKFLLETSHNNNKLFFHYVRTGIRIRTSPRTGNLYSSKEYISLVYRAIKRMVRAVKMLQLAIMYIYISILLSQPSRQTCSVLVFSTFQPKHLVVPTAQWSNGIGRERVFLGQKHYEEPLHIR